MRLVILDRDGVINKDSEGFIKSPEEWQPIAGSLEAIARLCRQDYKIVVVTNQSGISRKLLDVDMLNRIHNRMLDHVSKKGGYIDAIFFCPHGPDSECECRKPKPGMYHSIANRLKVKLTDIPCIGDSKRDLEAAMAVNARPILVRSGKGRLTEAGLEEKNGKRYLNGTVIPCFNNLADAVNNLLADQQAVNREPAAKAKS